MPSRYRTLGLWLAVLFLAVPFARSEEAPSGAKALEQLKAGNSRFTSDKPGAKNLGTDRRQELAKGQKPFAIILTCADSRVAPELVFDQGLGDLFVLRVAGNVADPAVLGSIEYAVEHLHSPLIIVMGHESCGAVKAAIDGGHLEGNLGALIQMVQVGKDLPKDAKAGFDMGVKNNVLTQTRLLTEKSAVLKEFAHSKRVEIVPAVYSLATGKVEWLDPKTVVATKETPMEVPGGKKAARIEVKVAVEDARVWIDGEETKTRGLSRIYETPALATDRDFKYQIKVVWTAAGREASREQTVSFRGGKTVVVDLSK